MYSARERVCNPVSRNGHLLEFQGHSMCGHGDLAMNVNHKLDHRVDNGLVAPKAALPWDEHLGISSFLGSTTGSNTGCLENEGEKEEPGE